MMSAAITAFMMAIREKDCAAQIHQQSDASDADRLVKTNFEWSK